SHSTYSPFLFLFFFFLTLRPPPTSTLFPYTTLFRSDSAFSSMNWRRGSTCSPMRIVKMRSASTASSEVTRTSVRVSGFMVVRQRDRKSTRLNSSHDQISYAVFCLKKKKKKKKKNNIK